MKVSRIHVRVIAGAVLLAVASPALSAQQAPVSSQPDPVRTQVEAFERSLRNAIEAAAGQLSVKVRQAFPGTDFAFQFQAQPIVTSWVMPDAGPTFHVLIPGIDGLSLQMYAMNARRSGQRVTPTGIVPADPATPSAPAPALIVNPDAEYTTLARQSLIDALLDHALALPVAPTQYLTVIAGELPTQPLSPFQQRSRMLILQLKGEDLTALRENRITRDEAKARIKESKYPN